MVTWVGPYKIVKELDTSYLIENLLNGEQNDVHATRLKHYADSTLGVTEELKHHVAVQGVSLGVREIKSSRYSKAAREWQLLVSWQGLEDAEDSWEALATIHDAVPDMVEAHVQAHGDSRLRKACTALREQQEA